MNTDEKRVKHLEFIQSNIARMNQCSFQMKGLTITVVAALLALYAASIVPELGKGNNMFIFIAIVPTVIFWVLDSYYLQQERKFNGLYNDVIHIENSRDINEFEMPLWKYRGGKYNLFCIMWSKTEVLLYLLIIALLVVAGVFL